MFVLGVTFPVETAAVALCQSLKPDLKTGIMRVSDTKVSGNVLKCLQENKFEDGETLVLLGTYWKGDPLATIQKTYPKSCMVMGCMDQKTAIVSTTDAKITYQEWNKETPGPLTLVMNLCLQDMPRGIISSVMSTYGNVIRLLDDRFHNKNIMESQVLFAGLFNYRPEQYGTLTDLERWVNLFSGVYDLTKLMEFGKAVLDIQQKIVDERVQKNSAFVTLPGGTQVRMVTGLGEFCNMMHAKLHEQFPDAKATATIHIELAGSTKHLRISLRSYDKDVDVAHLARTHLNGDGSDPTTAGGSISLPLDTLLTGGNVNKQ